MPSVAAARVCVPIFPAAEDQILIRKVSEPEGWLSNMSPHPIVYEDLKWWHAEAMSQALRFAPDDDATREALRAPRSPMSARRTTKRFRARQVVVPLSEADVENMRLCLALKLDGHGEVRRKFIASGERLLVEDCSSRGRRANNMFWSDVRVPDQRSPLGYAREGRKMLGSLLMKEKAMRQSDYEGQPRQHQNRNDY